MRRASRIALPLVAGALACSESGAGRRFGAPAPVDVGRPAPSYGAVAMNGDSVTLQQLRGKPVLLNVWATWCHPCRDEIPVLQALYDRYRDRGLELIGVSVDASGTEDVIREFAERYRMSYPIWRDPAETVSSRFLVVGVPATFLIDRAGVLRWKKTGPIGPRDSALVALIEQSLGPNQQAPE